LFYGTATLLGGELFLTARHVADELARANDEPHVISAAGNGEQAVPVIDCDSPWSGQADLAIGRVDGWLGLPLFHGLGEARGWDDIRSFGFPDELARSSDLRKYRLEPRFMRGYVMRQLRPSSDETGVTAASLELSFAVPQGMSGSPLLITTQRGVALAGIAVGSRDIQVVEYQHVEQRADGGEHFERTARIVEVGIGVRLAPLSAEPIPLAQDRTLEAIVGPVWISGE
jgi:Trypsin-like peptidase domain